MGLFISNCKGCGKEINWFLNARSNNCECGVYMTPEEVEASWDANYDKHIISVVVNAMAKTGDNLDTVCTRMHMNPKFFRDRGIGV